MLQVETLAETSSGEVKFKVVKLVAKAELLA
jgi:hypothetical protein